MSYQLGMRHLRYFLAVAEDLHFRKAAERLYISQPGLSKQIKEMELGMGVQLFERTNRKVALTKAGAFLQEELTRHAKTLDRTIHHAKLLHEGLVGDLRLGYVGSAMQNIIPELLISFREQHPDIVFSLKEMDNQRQIEQLISFDLDVGFVRLEKVPKGLEVYEVLREPFCLVLPAAHPVDSHTFESMAQLKEESFILFDPKYSPSYFEKVMQIFEDCSFTPVVTHNTIHSTSIYKLVENHFGISIVPKSLRSEEIAGVKFIELDRIPQRTALSAVWSVNNRNPVIFDFLDRVRTYYQALLLLVALFTSVGLNASDLVEVSPITDRIVLLRFDDGHIDYGTTEAGNVVYSRTLDTVAIYNLNNFLFTSATDASFTTPVNPVTVGRKSKSNDVNSSRPKPGDPEFILEHFVYLELPSPMRQGATYTLRMNGLAYNTNTFTFTFDAAALRSRAVHTSQVGYRSGGPKYAYVSQWMGDFDNGVITDGKGRFTDYAGKRFDVVRLSDGVSVYDGTVAMRKNQDDGGPATDTPFDGAPTWFPCDCDFEQSFTFSDVLEADFSGLVTPGEYRIVVTDMGASYPFTISADIYREPFNYVLRGIFYQRQGIVKETQDGTVYPRDYHPDDVDAARFRYDRNWRWEDSPHHNHKSADSDFAATPLPLFGWYHDAGDWDGYPRHGHIPLQLNLLYDLRPASFRDGDVGLRYKLAETDSAWVEESTNGIPDILDEAAWLIKFYRRAKDIGLALGLTTGGVPGGYSGVDAGALDGYPGWEDPRDLRFSAEAPFTTYMYAANAAMYAANLETAGDPGTAAADWRNEATEAWGWAEANLKDGDLGRYATAEIRLLAAAALFKSTGEARYQTIFKSALAVDKGYLAGSAGYDVPNYWEIAAALYTNLPASYPGLDVAFQGAVRQKILAVADAEYVTPHDRRGFRAAYAWNKPHFLGMQSTPMLTLLIAAHHLTGEERYAAAIDNSAAYFLGGNPDHVSWVTGLSEGSVKYPFHPNSWWLNDYDDKVYSNEILPGYVPYGSYMSPDFFGPGWSWTGDEDYSKTTMYPAYEHQTWPIGEQRIENRTSIAGSEFTTWQNMAPAAFTYGYLTDTTYGGYTFNRRPTVALELAAKEIPDDGGYLKASASADTRRVDYYFEEHFIGSATKDGGYFSLFWDPPLPPGTTDVAITAVAFDDKGLISIPSPAGRSSVNIVTGNSVAVSGVAITKRKKRFGRVGQSRQFEAATTPAAATNGTIFWSSTDNNVCTVSASGMVTAVGDGSCQITAASQDGGYSQSVTVRVGR